MNLFAIEDAATVWRVANPEHMCAGVVLVWRERAYGWKNELRDPQHERPGAFAVDVRGHVWLAIGGNDQDGAEEWESIERPMLDVAPVFAYSGSPPIRVRSPHKKKPPVR